MMKIALFCVVSVLACGMTVAAGAADQPGGAGAQMSMSPSMPGPEAKALEPFFGKGAAWTGTVPAGAMGPDSKEMTTHGKANCHPIYGGFSYGCEVEDTYGSGKDAMTWRGHMVVGYDATSKTYKGFSADNTGALVMWNGTLDGNKFVLESAAPILMMGQMLDDRLTWVRNGDGSIEFTDEHRAQGGDWVLGEKATMRTGAHNAAAAARGHMGGVKGEAHEKGAKTPAAGETPK